MADELAKIKDGEQLEPQKFWRIKKKICSKSKDPPSFMFDKKGNILTTNKAIENIALEVYAERIESNTIKPHLKDSETLTNALCES